MFELYVMFEKEKEIVVLVAPEKSHLEAFQKHLAIKYPMLKTQLSSR